MTKDIFVNESYPNRIKVYEQKNAIQKDYTLGKYYITHEKFIEMKNFIVEPNDIIVSCAGTIGEVYVLPNNAEIGIINQALMRVKLFNYDMLDFFLLYFDCIIKKESNEKGKGTGMKNIPSFDVLKKMLIPIPPLNEMIRIISFLKKINKKILEILDNNNFILRNIELLKRKILDDIFGENSRYKSYYEKISTIGNEIQIFDNYRKPVNSSERQDRKSRNNSLYPYYGATGLVDYIDNFLLDGEYVLLGEDGAPFLNKYSAKAYIVNGKIWVNNHVHILQSKDNNCLLMYYLNWFDYNQYVSGTTRLKLNQEKMKSIPYPIIKSSVQTKIVKEIDSMLFVLDKIKEQLI